MLCLGKAPSWPRDGRELRTLIFAIANNVKYKQSQIYAHCGKVSIPAITHKRIIQKLLAYHKKYVGIRSDYRKYGTNESIGVKLTNSKNKLETYLRLPEVALAQIYHVPKKESFQLKSKLFFLIRVPRCMIPDSVDIVESKKLSKR